jgi:DNA-binding NtrC family response regulator
VPHATRCPEEDDRPVARDAIFAPNELRKTIAPLFGHYVVMLAMQHRRAPVPVSSGLWKEIVRLGLPNNLDELAKLARRYLLIGDTRMMLAELRVRPRSSRRTPGAAGRREMGLQNNSEVESGEKCKHS